MNIKSFHSLLFVVLLCVWTPTYAEAQTPSTAIKGRITSQGKGLANVSVTDGQTCVLTDSKGFYSIPVIDPNASFVYISTPSGYLPNDSLNIPQFYKRIDKNRPQIYNFELNKNPKTDNRHTLLVHADPQFFKEENFNGYALIVEDCKETIASYEHTDVFGIDCGDLVGDKPQLYSQYINELNKTNIPFYRVSGNHDMNYGGRSDETSTKTYNSIFGPAYYSFNRGKVHYIVLDNVFYIGRDYFYMGYITEKIFQWLEQDLAHVPKGSTVFVAMHIPARLSETQEPFSYSNEKMGGQTLNASALFKMLEPYNAHILTGHMHYNKNIIHSPTLYEHNTAAICGTWWQGDYCLDGTPLGYGVYEINDDKVEWYFKSAGHPQEYQMRAYPVGQNSDFPDDITVNIWNWDKNWKVEWFENGVNSGEMTRFEGIDPKVAEMCADKDKLEFKWISPIKNEHMFRATPLSKNSTLEIIATDSFGKKYKTTIKPQKQLKNK
ncbi:calcineurin-like phosphoesterase C-terminal domain-containing protein [Petrimonas sulfuriphila]|uniref:calcineurin-like phosphoesterase C-terminal domain-containing protein n=1 Tax=Petrimonas TaxID=307628 RepID=UPI000E920A0B|nr:calcineurin-like phosphoesterase family protein [Petrimonas sp.]HAC74085.1 serine/threonine protein phosphatase [Porphyromonadaceae bacterium]MEA4997095.1 calcineurin-like phosphoesterase family protein [Petrimonas sp.]MEA5046834.1 calcineurin-like phosphoesterase family protein [Petrimonas sp.]MEA5071377.1 calcineurin-like phosphoesterase family protein [Petrimonas sp.]